MNYREKKEKYILGYLQILRLFPIIQNTKGKLLRIKMLSKTYQDVGITETFQCLFQSHNNRVLGTKTAISYII